MIAWNKTSTEIFLCMFLILKLLIVQVQARDQQQVKAPAES